MNNKKILAGAAALIVPFVGAAVYVSYSQHHPKYESYEPKQTKTKFTQEESLPDLNTFKLPIDGIKTNASSPTKHYPDTIKFGNRSKMYVNISYGVRKSEYIDVYRDKYGNKDARLLEETFGFFVIDHWDPNKGFYAYIRRGVNEEAGYDLKRAYTTEFIPLKRSDAQSEEWSLMPNSFVDFHLGSNPENKFFQIAEELIKDAEGRSSMSVRRLMGWCSSSYNCSKKTDRPEYDYEIKKIRRIYNKDLGLPSGFLDQHDYRSASFSWRQMYKDYMSLDTRTIENYIYSGFVESIPKLPLRGYINDYLKNRKYRSFHLPMKWEWWKPKDCNAEGENEDILCSFSDQVWNRKKADRLDPWYWYIKANNDWQMEIYSGEENKKIIMEEHLGQVKFRSLSRMSPSIERDDPIWGLSIYPISPVFPIGHPGKCYEREQCIY